MESSFYLWALAFGRWGNQDRFPPFYVRSFSYRWLRLDPRPVLAALPRPFRFPDRKRLFVEVMRRLAHRHGKPRFGDKTPSHVASLGQIFRDFPDARVIRMMRDPRHVVSSLRNMPWAPRNLIAVTTLAQMEPWQARRFRNRLLEVRLDELVGAPRVTMARVLDFVGEPFAEEVLDHAVYAPRDLPPLPWFQSAQRATSPTRSVRPGLSAEETRVVEFLCRPQLRRMSLSPAPLEPRAGRGAGGLALVVSPSGLPGHGPGGAPVVVGFTPGIR